MLCTRTEGDRIVPHYLTERDHPWLRAILDEHARFVGRKRREFRERMREPLPVFAPRAKLRIVCHLLDKMGPDQLTAPVPPREARWLTFQAAAARPIERARILAAAADAFGVGSTELEESLFADLRSDKRIGPLPEELGPERLAVAANLSIVGSLMRRAKRVRIAAWGSTRALVRQARLCGLICLVKRLPRTTTARARDELAPIESVVLPDGALQEGVLLDISGPFAIFRHTEVYGRALSTLVPRAAWCNRFEITADCVLGRATHTARLVVRSGDPIGAGRELSRYDSRLEERFAKEFARIAPQWDVIREPSALDVGDALVFPDFELVNRREPARRWLLEIAGFWTPEYLESKLRRLQRAGLDRLVLCIDERRRCSEADIPPRARVVLYRTRIDPRAVLAVIDPAPRRPTRR